MGVKSILSKVGTAFGAGVGALNDDPDGRPYLKRRKIEPPDPLPDISSADAPPPPKKRREIEPPDPLPDISSADAPPPPKKMTALEHAESLPNVRPARPATIDAKAELGEAPIKKLGELPDLPTRKPLDKSQTTGFKNRMRGAFEAAGNAGAKGASGLTVLGAMISGGVDREKANKQQWERNVELPEIRKRNAKTKEIVAAQKSYDASAKDIEERNKNKEERYKTDFEHYKWGEDLRQKALENEQKRKDTAAENEAKRKAEADKDKRRYEWEKEKQKNFQAYDKLKREEEFKRGLTKQQIEANSRMRLEQYRHEHNLERDLIEYVAESGDDGEPSDEDVKRERDGAASVGMPISREQAIDDIKRRTGKKSKPGASKAVTEIGRRFPGWGRVPAGK